MGGRTKMSPKLFHDTDECDLWSMNGLYSNLHPKLLEEDEKMVYQSSLHLWISIFLAFFFFILVVLTILIMSLQKK